MNVTTVPSITALPIKNLPKDTIKFRMRWRWDSVGMVFVKTPGQIAQYALLVSRDGESLEIPPIPEALNKASL